MAQALPRAAQHQRRPFLAAVEDWLDRHISILFPLPAVLTMIAIVAVPVLYVAWLGFYDWTLTSARGSTFVGLDNYVNLLTRDTRFRICGSAWAKAIIFSYFASSRRSRHCGWYRYCLRPRASRPVA